MSMAPEALGVAAETELSELNRRFRPALISFFLRRLRNRSEAEDLTQEVFLRLAAAAPAQMRSAAAYIFQVAANLLRDRARREKIRHEYAATLLPAEELDFDPIDPARILLGRRTLDALAARLRELPERTLTMFVLYRLENMDRRAIAEAFGCSVSTVEKEVAKAMAHLMLHRKELE